METLTRTFQEYITEWNLIEKAATAAQWAKGDLLAQLEVDYGEQTLQRFAEEIETPYQTCLNLRRVAVAYPQSSRCRELSWSVHEVFAGQEDRTTLVATFRGSVRAARELIGTRTTTPVNIPESVPEPREELNPEPVPDYVPDRWTLPYCGRGSGGDNEWYTPKEYAEAARKVLDVINLDPASCQLANETIKAERYYTKEQDGLEQPWHCETLWCNPPYSAPFCEQFINRLCDEHSSGNVTEAILLVSNSTDTRWFQRALINADAVCFPKGRVQFYREDGSGGGNNRGSAVFYFGADPDRFREIFTKFGFVVTL